jgi:SET domain-containing protein
MGRGVFATKNFRSGEVIEICPVVPIPRKLIKDKNPTGLQDFLENWLFEWENDFQSDAMVLGYGMIYNHSENPNAKYEMDFEKNIVTFRASKKIKKGEEIFIDYRITKDKVYDFSEELFF